MSEQEHLSRSVKFVILVGVGVFVIIVLLIFAFYRQKPQTSALVPSRHVATPSTQVTPTPTARTVLSLSPNPLNIRSGQTGNVDVILDTQNQQVTAVQLEIKYDPNVITDVKVTPKALLGTNSVVLINHSEPTLGRFTYAAGITPNQKLVQGRGIVATISFMTRQVDSQQSQLTLLPTSIVTAKGVYTSILQGVSGTTIRVNLEKIM